MNYDYDELGLLNKLSIQNSKDKTSFDLMRSQTRKINYNFVNPFFKIDVLILNFVNSFFSLPSTEMNEPNENKNANHLDYNLLSSLLFVSGEVYPWSIRFDGFLNFDLSASSTQDGPNYFLMSVITNFVTLNENHYPTTIKQMYGFNEKPYNYGSKLVNINYKTTN